MNIECCSIRGRHARLYIFVAALLLSTINSQLSTCFAQGSLTPPGAPAPTMKSLDEVEPRINIQRTINPLPNDANYHYIISTPGSYYLSSNLDVTKPNGIHITVAGVTVDLNGFQISRSSGSGGDGITIDPTADRCTVKNGSVAGFTSGVQCVQSLGTIARAGSFLQLSVAGCLNTGIKAGHAWQVDGCKFHNNLNGGLLTGNGCTITNCTAMQNLGPGITASDGCTLNNCTAFSNQGTYAISANLGSTLNNCTARANISTSSVAAAILVNDGSTLSNCTVYGNQCTWGIYAISGCTLTNCSATSNHSSESVSAGINTGAGCNIIACTSAFNESTNGTASRSTGIGILTGSQSTVKDCTANSNKGDGIQTVSFCTITGCTSVINGSAGIGDGVHTTGFNNRIDGNIAHANSGIGIHGHATADYIIRNIANGNGAGNYSPASGTYVGPFSTPGSATSPWANF